MTVPLCSTSLSSADNQVGPTSHFIRTLFPLLFIPKYQQPVSAAPCVCVCVFPRQPIDVWVIPCIQLCKINTRIKHQMTEMEPGETPPSSISAAAVSFIRSRSALLFLLPSVPLFFIILVFISFLLSFALSNLLLTVSSRPRFSFVLLSAAFLSREPSMLQISFSWPEA